VVWELGEGNLPRLPDSHPYSLALSLSSFPISYPYSLFLCLRGVTEWDGDGDGE